MVCFVHLVDLVYLVQPNKLDKPNKPNNGLKVVRDAAKDVEGAVHAAESKAYGGFADLECSEDACLYLTV
ncbi:MAG: hypothetical protein HY281_12570 [Nitrospirae bacterium]|nr:hypothetical protein [Nitrospirota bacterium]